MSSTETEALTALLEFVRRQRGVDFGVYKESSVHRRLEQRMTRLGVTTYAEFLDHLQASPNEMNGLLDTLFINVTRFFRDVDAWNAVRTDVLLPLVSADAQEPIRIWCAGVASGEESYTVAMMLAEVLGYDEFRRRVKVFATDADDAALDDARAGVYTAKALADVPQDLHKYFQPTGDAYLFDPELRRNIIFGRHNLLEDAPISRLDLLICRNTMMYFNREAQGRVFARFHFALKDSGTLFLGKAETLLTRRLLFKPLNHRLRIFSKVPNPSYRDRMLSLERLDVRSDARDAPMPLSDQLRHSAFRTSLVAQVLMDAAGRVAFANEGARKLLGIADASIGRPFVELEASRHPVELRAAVHQSMGERRAVLLEGVEAKGIDGSRRFFDITISPLEDGTHDQTAFSIAFTDVTGSHDLRAQLEGSHGELETAYEELQSTNEELETTNEELQSTIEELETTNEELQSTNEELETMNEELQSTSEEVRQINDQLADRSDEISRLNAYLRSIVDGQQNGVIVLDTELIVSMWNARAHDLWGLREDEVARQPFLNLDMGLPVHELRDVMRRTLRGDADAEQIVLPATNRRGRAFECSITITQMRGTGGQINGVILIMEPRPSQ